MLIRRLEPGDEAFLWKALYHAIHVPPGEAPPTPEVIRQPDLARYVAGWMQTSDDLGFVTEVDGKPIGAVWLRCWTGEGKGYGFVDTATPELAMSLLPGYRGRGIGTLLLRCLLAVASRHYAAVSLSVSASNPARRMYEREGFVPVGDPKGDSITMVRRFVP